MMPLHQDIGTHDILSFTVLYKIEWATLYMQTTSNTNLNSDLNNTETSM
jgi:hypothetical protein